MTIERGTGTKAINGLMIETTIQGKDKSEYIDLPDAITINVPLFVRTEPRQIEIDLLATAGDTNVFMRAVSADVATAMVAAFDEMLDACSEIEGVVVGTGFPNSVGWDYLG